MGHSFVFCLVANTIKEHRWFFNIKFISEGWYATHYHARSLDYIDKYLSGNIINKSVSDGEYDPDNCDEYIKRLIREDKVSDASVVVVLVGPNTKKRKHVDWEIYAGLRDSVNGCSGLVCILLPEFPLTSDGKFYTKDLPARLGDNVDSGYAKCYTWDYAMKHFDEIIETAYSDRKTLKNKKINSRLQMQKNL